MRRYTRLVRSSAFVALLSALAMTTAAWHPADDDLACAPLFERTANGAPVTVTAARTQAQPQHCLLCHWSRWIRSTQTNQSCSVAPCETSARLVLTVALAAPHCHCDLTFGRAPPA